MKPRADKNQDGLPENICCSLIACGVVRMIFIYNEEVGKDGETVFHAWEINTKFPRARVKW